MEHLEIRCSALNPDRKHACISLLKNLNSCPDLVTRRLRALGTPWCPIQNQSNSGEMPTGLEPADVPASSPRLRGTEYSRRLH